jgi:hypothetical protein
MSRRSRSPGANACWASCWRASSCSAGCGATSWQRRRRSRWLLVGYASVGAAGVLALVMGVDYLTDPVDLGPLVLSIVGVAGFRVGASGAASARSAATPPVGASTARAAAARSSRRVHGAESPGGWAPPTAPLAGRSSGFAELARADSPRTRAERGWSSRRCPGRRAGPGRWSAAARGPQPAVPGAPRSPPPPAHRLRARRGRGPSRVCAHLGHRRIRPRPLMAPRSSPR